VKFLFLLYAGVRVSSAAAIADGIMLSLELEKNVRYEILNHRTHTPDSKQRFGNVEYLPLVLLGTFNFS